MIYAVILLAIFVAILAVMLTVNLMRLGECRHRLSESLEQNAKSSRDLDNARTEASAATAEATGLRARLQASMESLDMLRRRYEADEERFSRLSAQTLQHQSGMFADRSEARLKDLLLPLREDLERFKARIDQCYSDESRERFALKEAVAALLDQSRSIGNEARELASALRGNSKTQGDWGEMILLTLLEKSGLREGEEFVVQQTRDLNGNLIRNDDGSQLRPDVVVYLPENRAVVIDSKVSLSAFTEWVNADDSTASAREAREAAGKRHVESVRKHIAELNAKSYQDRTGGRSLDFVLMFIPNEAAYMAAMSLSSELWQEAYDKRVLIVSPTHLISVLRLTSQLWNHERQTTNALRIASEAGKMYDKFVGFVDDMKRIERAISQTSSAWSDAMRKLSTGTGNLVNRAESLRRMGIKATKKLPPDMSDDTPDDREGTNQSLVR